MRSRSSHQHEMGDVVNVACVHCSIIWHTFVELTLASSRRFRRPCHPLPLATMASIGGSPELAANQPMARASHSLLLSTLVLTVYSYSPTRSICASTLTPLLPDFVHLLAVTWLLVCVIALIYTQRPSSKT
ncbi:hypothetical protein DE146DRAFT_49321 [Phaeosphaeria sp. MPI-PUGE-AT-0046c]|nr:hypothetical protein DE146DRAFT_49321 [Phaeosphaeria sp. MPI-PUGE-AT-0046c]